MVTDHDETVLTEDEIAILVNSAVHAPSMHNTQPWRFDVDGSVVDVIVDPDRALPAEDPAGRMIRIGLGAATFNLRVAAAMLGHETTFAIDPDPARPDIVVRLFLGRRQCPNPALASLYGELRRRHTYRGPLLATEVSPRVLELITGAVRAEGAELRWLDADDRDRFDRILREADELDRHDEDRLLERERWIGGERTGLGVPDTALGPAALGPAAHRDLSAGFENPDRDQAVFEYAPLIAVLTTRTDDFVQWVRAGMALQHALLTATSYEVAASFLNQAIEYVPLRQRVQELIGRDERPQLIIRLGYSAEAAASTPRLPWRESLTRRH